MITTITIQNDVTSVVPLKYLSIFWRTLNMPFNNCETNLILTWSENCFDQVAINAPTGAYYLFYLIYLMIIFNLTLWQHDNGEFPRKSYDWYIKFSIFHR